MNDIISHLHIDGLHESPFNPRQIFDDGALHELSVNIRTEGRVLSPLLVRPRIPPLFAGDPEAIAGYEIVFGHRRYRAAVLAGLTEVPCMVRAMTDDEARRAQISENLQRKDVHPIEEAEAYQKLIGDFGHTQEMLGKLVHKSRSHIANLLRLLDLPRPVQERVVDGELTMGHARALIGAPDVEKLVDQVIAKGLSVRETERLARAAKPDPRARSGGDGSRDADLAALENQLGDLLGLSVRIAHSAKGGTLTLSYATLDQLDMVCQRLSGELI